VPQNGLLLPNATVEKQLFACLRVAGHGDDFDFTYLNRGSRARSGESFHARYPREDGGALAARIGFKWPGQGGYVDLSKLRSNTDTQGTRL
jgi:hypothetical protein